MYEWVSEWVSEGGREGGRERASEWASERASEWVSERASEQEWVSGAMIFPDADAAMFSSSILMFNANINCYIYKLPNYFHLCKNLWWFNCQWIYPTKCGLHTTLTNCLVERNNPGHHRFIKTPVSQTPYVPTVWYTSSNNAELSEKMPSCQYRCSYYKDKTVLCSFQTNNYPKTTKKKIANTYFSWNDDIFMDMSCIFNHVQFVLWIWHWDKLILKSCIFTADHFNTKCIEWRSHVRLVSILPVLGAS